MNIDYIKDYKDKELKQYIIASFFAVIASIGLSMYGLQIQDAFFTLLLKALSIDIFEIAICILVYLFSELWGNEARTKIVYIRLPSDSVFSNISNGKIRTLDFDVSRAKNKYHYLSKKTGAQQTTEWNKMLLNARKDEVGSVIEAERCQLLARDMCMSTVTLFLGNVVAFIVVAVVLKSFMDSLKLFAVPFTYLVLMFVITRCVANKKAKRLVGLVIKNDLLTEEKKSGIVTT